MDAVGKAAGAVVREVRRQLTAKPGILRGEDKPDYGICVDIVTKAALREMIMPALLPVAFVARRRLRSSRSARSFSAACSSAPSSPACSSPSP